MARQGVPHASERLDTGVCEGIEVLPSPLSVPSPQALFCCQGTYVLQDNSFPLLITMGSGPQYLEEAPKVSGEGQDMPICPPLLGLSWGWGLAFLFPQCSVPHPYPSSWPSPAAFCVVPSIRWASRAWSPPPWLPCPHVSYWGMGALLPWDVCGLWGFRIHCPSSVLGRGTSLPNCM